MNHVRTLLYFLGTLLVAACGGGGGSSAPSPPIAPTPVVTVAPSTASVMVGQLIQLAATTNATGPVTWSSSNAAVATVNSLAWDAVLQASAWGGTPVWIHGDLQPANLLVQHGHLSAVIDFGCLGVGDPACDLMVAWTLLSAKSREVFRTALQVDEATWTRGRGWALSFGLIALPYYQTTNPVLARIAKHAIDEVIADHKQGLQIDE